MSDTNRPYAPYPNPQNVPQVVPQAVQPPMPKSHTKIIIIVAITVIFVIGLLLASYLLRPSDLYEEVSFDVSEVGIEGTYKLTEECTECNNYGECSYVCANGCARENLLFQNLLPLWGPYEFNGECSCLCVPSVHINEDIIIEAISSKNPDICNEITTPTVYTRDGCLAVMAMMLEDETVCESIERQSFESSKDFCYTMLAVAKRDIGLCSKVVEEQDPNFSRGFCEEFVKDAIQGAEGVFANYEIPR